MLDRGAACLRCRKHKVKCNGLKPYCGRCHKLHEECVYPSGVARRRRASDTLEARVLELELVTLKLTLLSTHNLFLASTRLLERIGRLGNLAQPISSLRLAKSTLQLVHPGGKNSEAEGRRSKGLGEDTSTTDLSAIQKIVEKQLCSYSPTEIEGLEELPLSLSLHLIELFLPSHAVYYFLVDVPHFVRRVSLPSSHPDSIHPCLLNVCYLAACTNQGGELTQFKPLFLRRTRRFLQQSLMFADRITHFLWANVVLSVFFAKERRLLESITTASAATHFAVACGLSLPGSPVSQHNNSITNDNLLPSPIDADEADDRVRLSHAIYLGIQAFPQLCGYPPTFPFEDCWSPISQEASLRLQDGKVSMVANEQWRLELYLRVLVTNMFERVKEFARSVTMNGEKGRAEEYISLETQIDLQRASFPPINESYGSGSLEAPSTFSSQSVLGHVTLYGSGLILHSLWAANHPESRAKMIECLQALVDISVYAQEYNRPRLGLLNMIHIMNAARVIACELRRAETRERADLSVSYCRSLELLLDFMDATMIAFPAWVDTLSSLKDTLVVAATSLSN